MKKSVFSVVVFCLSGALTPASAQAMTLEEALEAAYAGNPQLEAQRAALRAVNEQVPQALSGWRPSVALSGQAGVARSEAENMGKTVSVSSNPRGWGVSVSQPLFMGFRTQSQLSAAKQNVLAGRQQLASVEQGVLLQATEAYLNVARDKAIVALNRSNEQVLERQMEATRDRFRVGELTRTDVSQAESRLAGAVAARIAAEGQLSSSQAAFERIVGLPPAELSEPAAPAFLPSSQNQAVDEAYRAQPDVLAAQFQAEAAKDMIALNKGALLPSLSLDGSWQQGWEMSGASAGRSDNAQLMAKLSVPLYQRGAEYSKVREAKHAAGRAQIMVDLARRKARQDAIQSWDNWKSAQARIVSISAQIEAAQLALEGVKREAHVGSRTVLDVLNSEQELLNARVSLVSAQRDELLAAYVLASSVGRLTATALKLNVDLYDPVENYESVRKQWVGFSGGVDEERIR